MPAERFLPAELLQLVLEQVHSTKERIGCCSSVSKRWQAAATAATTQVSTVVVPGSSLQAWLAAHAEHAHLQQMVLVGKEADTSSNNPGRVNIDIPFDKLAHLKNLALQDLKVDAASCSSTPEAAAAAGAPASNSSDGDVPNSLAALTKLEDMWLVNCSSSLEHLAACTSLRHLQLQEVDDSSSAGVSTALSKALPQLQQLTSLLLLEMQGLSDEALAGLSSLQQLMVLGLQFPAQEPEVTGGSFAVLPSSLTELSLGGPGGQVPTVTISSRRTPGLCMLPRLQQLNVFGVKFNADILSSLPQLQDLRLDSCALRPEGLPGTRALLGALRSLTGLQHLHLTHTITVVTDDEDDPESGPAAFAALTASTHLTYLGLEECPLPDGAGRFMFPAGRLLPLQQLRLSLQYTFDVMDLTRALGCLPKLASLYANQGEYLEEQHELLSPAELPAFLAALARLKALTSLDVFEQPITDDLAQQHLTKLTGLQSLVLGPPITASGVMALTVLTRMTALTLYAMVESGDPKVESADYELYNTVGELLRLKRCICTCRSQQPSCLTAAWLSQEGFLSRISPPAPEGCPSNLWEDVEKMRQEHGWL